MTVLQMRSARPSAGRHRRGFRSAERRFRPDIEGLRAIAVLLVVLFHAGVPGLPGGYVGVDVFFVMSGYLITAHLVPGLIAGRGIALRDFYARRVRRLLPLASLVIVVTVLATWRLTSALTAREVGTDAVWASLFVMNLHLARTGVDYQANQDPSPLQHFWSLAVEEQFYLLWPVLLVAAGSLALRTSRIPVRGALIVLASAIVIGSFWHSIVLTDSEPTVSYFIPTTRAWELGVGGLVALTASHASRHRWLQSTPVAGLGLGMIAVAALRFTESTPFPGAAAAMPAMGTALVLVAGLAHPTRVESMLLGRTVLQVLGRLSYGWYLWHWPVLIVAELALQRHVRVLEALALTALALWMAMCSAIAIETPLRTYPALVASSSRSLRIGGILILGTVVIAAATVVVAPRLQGVGAATAPVLVAGNITAAVVASENIQTVPADLSPELFDAADDKPDLAAADGGSCMVGLLASEVSTDPDASCVAGGTEQGSPTVVVTGDSHAYQWVPALREIALDRGWRLVSMTKSGCPLYHVDLVNTQLQREYTECTQWRQEVFRRIAAEQPALVITTGAIFSARPGDFTARWVSGVSSTVHWLTDQGIPTAVLADTPYPRRDVPQCIARNMTVIADQCNLMASEALSDPERRSATAAAAAAAGATVIDPVPWFCGDQRCPVIIGKFVVYSDNSHVTATYARQLAPDLARELPVLS